MSTRELAHTLIDELDETQLNGLVEIYNELAEYISDTERYEQIMKTIRNAKYINKIEKAFEQLENGSGKPHELIEADDNE